MTQAANLAGLANGTNRNAEFDFGSGVRIRANSYTTLARGPNNNDGIFFNVVPSTSGTTYTPVYTSESSAGSTQIGMPSGGNGGFVVRVYRHGTSTATYNEAAMTTAVSITDSGIFTIPAQPFFIAGINSGSDATYSSGSAIVYNNILNSNSANNRSSSYSTSTGRFTAPVAGLYNFFWQTYYTNSASSTGSMQTAIYVNGNTQSSSGDAYGVQPVTPNSAGGTIGMCSTAILLLAAGDYVTIQPRSATVRIYNGHTYFGGYLVG